ncbi:unnamed protein product [Cuscuta campestris]|uniref:Uncharacterized protein n=1 Tax=Cuscuta campestris TaxID=132261 RepID=A0A484M2G4_9ASTE|nr:unnamed protein product [Cuscuta campestris]
MTSALLYSFLTDKRMFKEAIVANKKSIFKTFHLKDVANYMYCLQQIWVLEGSIPEEVRKHNMIEPEDNAKAME